MSLPVHEARGRSAAEVAFVVMRLLAAVRLIWARGGALPLEALSTLLGEPADAIALAIERLREEGIAELSAADGTARLTDAAAREFLARGPGPSWTPGYERVLDRAGSGPL